MKRQTYTLLIVEDDEDDRGLLDIAFSGTTDKITVRFVTSGNEAIAYLQGTGKFADRTAYEYPSFLITDLKMADGDGFAVLEFLRTTPGSAISPVVVLSGSIDEHDIEQSYQLGAAAYLTKPSALEDLRKMAKVLTEFWMMIEVPGVNAAGKRNVSAGSGKLGARFDGEQGKS